VLIISLIEKDIFPVISLSRILLQVTLWADTVFLTQTLPEFISNYIKRDLVGRLFTLVAALSNLQCNDFPRHFI
jgi:hypothetical protein